MNSEGWLNYDLHACITIDGVACSITSGAFVMMHDIERARHTHLWFFLFPIE